MMDIKTVSLNVILMLICFIQRSHSVRCYECSSLISPTCGDPFTVSSTDTKYISETCNRCLERTTVNNGTTVFGRECSSLTLDGCITVSASESQCFCSTDLCNMSPALTSSLVSLVMCLITLLMS